MKIIINRSINPISYKLWKASLHPSGLPGGRVKGSASLPTLLAEQNTLKCSSSLLAAVAFKSLETSHKNADAIRTTLLRSSAEVELQG